MQVLPSTRAKAGRPSRRALYTALFAGTIFTAVGLALLYLVFGGAFMTRFMPSGRPSTYDLVIGALAWTFALTAPAGFGLVGLARLATAYERWRARRPRITPSVRLRRAIGDDHVVATSVRLPVGNRMLPELIIGPFGAAVIEELPPPGAVLSRGVRTWEVRVGNGYIRTIENPMDRATHDAEIVRSWLSPEDADHVLKPRADGNEHLHRFLTIADGVVRAQGRKIIFSTNLPNVGDLDDALIRPGRCYARLNIRTLTPEVFHNAFRILLYFASKIINTNFFTDRHT